VYGCKFPDAAEQVRDAVACMSKTINRVIVGLDAPATTGM